MSPYGPDKGTPLTYAGPDAAGTVGCEAVSEAVASSGGGGTGDYTAVKGEAMGDPGGVPSKDTDTAGVTVSGTAPVKAVLFWQVKPVYDSTV